MYWANFIHIYQPPNQHAEMVRKIAEECYRPLIRIFKAAPMGRVTLNINACLTEHLALGGFEDVIEDLGRLAYEGRIELTASAKYHSVLPLLPEGEMRRQVEKNMQTNRKFFKEAYSPRGFFLPEMCYSRGVARVIKAMGFKWFLVDEIACGGRLNQCRRDSLYTVASLSPLRVFFKERPISTDITFGRCKDVEQFMQLVEQRGIKSDEYLLTGTDGEIYGHHQPGLECFLEEVLQDSRFKTRTISQLEELFDTYQEVEPVASSWSSWEEEIERGVPYLQWNDPDNIIHQLQWQMAYRVFDLVEGQSDKIKKEVHWQSARDSLDKALYSCQWWWASCSPWWAPDMIKQGTTLLYQTALLLRRIQANEAALDRIKQLKDIIDQTADKWQRSDIAKVRQNRYMEAHKQVSGLLSFG